MICVYWKDHEGPLFPRDKKVAINDDDFHLFHVVFFTFGHPYGSIWTHLGPYGPVYHFLFVLYDLDVVFRFSLYDFQWFYT